MTDVVRPLVSAVLDDRDGRKQVTAYLLGRVTRVKGKPVMCELFVFANGRYTTTPFANVSALNREAAAEMAWAPPAPGEGAKR